MADWKVFLWGPVIGYLAGSIPFGLLIGRLKGQDIRKAGSGNIGATNVGRIFGWGWFFVVFSLDVAKGFFPVLLIGKILHRSEVAQAPQVMYLACLAVVFSCMAGHIWPVWLGFKGGKGVATGLGVLLGVWPYLAWPGLGALGVWLVCVAIWRYVSLGSMLAAGSLPGWYLLLAWRLDWPIREQWPLLAFGSALAVLVIFRHLGNLKRLLAGTEAKIGRRNK